MNINSINTTSFGVKLVKSKPLHPNKMIRTKKPKKIETVIVLPDGTIEKGRIAKIRNSIDNGITKLLEGIIFG